MARLKDVVEKKCVIRVHRYRRFLVDSRSTATVAAARPQPGTGKICFSPSRFGGDGGGDGDGGDGAQVPGPNPALRIGLTKSMNTEKLRYFSKKEDESVS